MQTRSKDTPAHTTKKGAEAEGQEVQQGHKRKHASKPGVDKDSGVPQTPTKKSLTDQEKKAPPTKAGKAPPAKEKASEKQEQQEPDNQHHPEERVKEEEAPQKGTEEIPAADDSPKEKTEGTQSKGKAAEKQEAVCKPSDTSPVKVNRAPVLTMWVASVAKRQGYSWDAGLTFGKTISGMYAQSKGRSIGVIEPKERDDAAAERRREKDRRNGIEKVQVFNTQLRAKKVGGEGGEYVAVDTDGKEINPSTVSSYLHRAFGDRYQDVKCVMMELASSMPPEELEKQAYDLYTKIRPDVAQGARGWGAKGELDLQMIERMAKEHAGSGS